MHRPYILRDKHHVESLFLLRRPVTVGNTTITFSKKNYPTFTNIHNTLKRIFIDSRINNCEQNSMQRKPQTPQRFEPLATNITQKYRYASITRSNRVVDVLKANL